MTHSHVEARPPRWVLHADVDAFFASVEILDDPRLAAAPLAVGGLGGRAVVASCSYSARVYGVRSAMPMGEARRLCPGLVVVPPRFERYSTVSSALMERLERVSPTIEAVALDEAYLDVSTLDRSTESLTQLAVGLRADIAAQLGLDVSVGIAPNKLLAKLASEAAKPRIIERSIRDGRGVVTVDAADVPAFLAGRSVRELHGVGPATASRLARVAIRTIDDVLAAPVEVVRAAVGARVSAELLAAARGEDSRRVSPERATRSIGVERTFESDLMSLDEVDEMLVDLAAELAARLRAHDQRAATLTLKMRYSDFSTVTRSRTVADPLLASTDVRAVAVRLARETEPERGVRLLGLSGSSLREAGAQLSLLEAALPGLDTAVRRAATARAAGEPEDRSSSGGAARVAAESAGDRVRQRFGPSALGWNVRRD